MQIFESGTAMSVDCRLLTTSQN